MFALILVLLILGIVLLGAGAALHFLFWVGGVVLVIAIIVWLLRAITGNNRN